MIVHTTRGSVLEDLGLSPEQVRILKIREVLLASLIHHIRDRKLSQRQVTETLGITRHQVSRLMRGRISTFPVEALIDMHTALGIPVRVEVGMID